ncbi:MAG: LysM peptidoglycan-binding domain-containing protein [Gammaproteobacteria bacterium]|nr:LysM peptidoglycan-binding domain-containing protein [Gammaproteobacteria bacterium]
MKHLVIRSRIQGYVCLLSRFRTLLQLTMKLQTFWILRLTTPLFLAAMTTVLSGCLTQVSQIQETPDKVDTTLQFIQPGIAVSHIEPQVIEPSLSDLYPELKNIATGSCDKPDDLWSVIQAGLQLNDYNHRSVTQQLNWYVKNQSYLDRVADRATPYLYLLVEEAKKRKIPLEIALLPVVESAFKPFAYSHGRAAGLWQIIPGTGKRFGLKQTWWYDGRRDVMEATRAAYDYLEYLNKLYDGDWLMALAAYNVGEGNIRKAVRKNRKLGRKVDFWSLDLPQETRAYVPKLLAVSEFVSNPPAYGIILKSIPNKPYLQLVSTESQIDLDLAAELAELSTEELYRYNPAFNRWATDPDGPHHLLLPKDKAEIFNSNLASYPSNERIQWKRHKVRDGEVLGTIAEKYYTTVKLLKKVNKFKGNNIRIGKTIVIPVARKSLDRYRLSSSERLKSLQKVKRSGNRIEIRVARGDTFWDIAQKYSVTSSSIARWNGMSPRDTLRPGQKLVIWTKEKREKLDVSAVNPATFIHPFESNTRQRVGYKVRNGDSLARIAQKFRVSVKNLKRWNNKLKDKKYLQPGDRITVYVDVKRQS